MRVGAEHPPPQERLFVKHFDQFGIQKCFCLNNSSITFPSTADLVILVHSGLPDIDVYRKSSIEPQGGLFEFGHSKGRLKREESSLERGRRIHKSNDKDLYDSYLFLLRHILRIQHTILPVKYIDSTQFYLETISNPTCKVVRS